MYNCENEEITEPWKIALKTLRGIGNEGVKCLNVSSLSEFEKKNLNKL